MRVPEVNQMPELSKIQLMDLNIVSSLNFIAIRET